MRLAAGCFSHAVNHFDVLIDHVISTIEDHQTNHLKPICPCQYEKFVHAHTEEFIPKTVYRNDFIWYIQVKPQHKSTIPEKKTQIVIVSRNFHAHPQSAVSLVCVYFVSDAEKNNKKIYSDDMTLQFFAASIRCWI